MSEKPDTSNAHVRKGRRDNPEVKANDAKRILDDPAFQRGFEETRNALIAELEGLKHDGSVETDDYQLEVCRTLRTLRSLKGMIGASIDRQKLRVHDFRSGAPKRENAK